MCASVDKKKTPFDRRYLLFALRILGDFGASIAVPLVILVLAGQYLDDRFGGGLRYTIAAFALAAAVSGASIYRKARAYGKEFAALDNDKSEDV